MLIQQGKISLSCDDYLTLLNNHNQWQRSDFSTQLHISVMKLLFNTSFQHKLWTEVIITSS